MNDHTERVNVLLVKNGAVDGDPSIPGCAAILAVDLSRDDGEHDENLVRIKEICGLVDEPVIGTGHIGRLEDVKKLIYAGCSRVALDEEALGNEALVSEAMARFGAERLAAIVRGDRSLPDGLRRMRPVGRLDKAGVASCVLDEGIARKPMSARLSWDELKKGPDGLVPVVVQDYRTDEVLMLAYMDEESYVRTLETGKMTYHSRSRDELWVKGETSGHYQFVRSLTADCDKDTILAKVRQIGAACHTGSRSCFFNEIISRDEAYKNPQKVLEDVYQVIVDRKAHPKEGSYTNYLFDKGLDKILKKCGEEATEMVIAAKNPGENEIVYEISDLLYHMMVLMAQKGVTWDDIGEELSKR